VDTAFAILLIPLLLHTAIDQGFGAWLNEDFVLFTCIAGLADAAFVASRARGRDSAGSHVYEDLALAR
jgi:hypothetical protein